MVVGIAYHEQLLGAVGLVRRVRDEHVRRGDLRALFLLPLLASRRLVNLHDEAGHPEVRVEQLDRPLVQAVHAVRLILVGRRKRRRRQRWYLRKVRNDFGQFFGLGFGFRSGRDLFTTGAQ
jgi:hypothetical protein